MVHVDKEKCSKVAAVFQSLQIRPEFYKREFLSFNADRETKLRVYFLSVAICHQTHNLYHPAMNLWGWDYLEYGFLDMVKNRNPLLNPGYLSICDPDALKTNLLLAFSPNANPANSSLDRINERVNMIVDICGILKSEYESSVSKLIDSADGMLINNGKGLYETLSRFLAYSDPLQKKISFFIKLAIDAGILKIKDKENLVPIMDYHMQRVLLRMGCVIVDDELLRKNLINRVEVNSDLDVRNACIEATRIICEISGQEILKMNDFLWPLGRSCCNETTLCGSLSCLKSPCTFETMANIRNHSNCLFEDVCSGSKIESFRLLWEPQVITHYY